MSPANGPGPSAHWLAENGPEQLEDLLRAVLFGTTSPIATLDSHGVIREISRGAARMLGLKRHRAAGLSFSGLLTSDTNEHFANLLCRSNGESASGAGLEDDGHTAESLQLLGASKKLDYRVLSHLLPGLHVMVLREAGEPATLESLDASKTPAPPGLALFLLDPEGRIAEWYGGASQMYGYAAEEVVGQPVSVLCAEKGPTDWDKIQLGLSRARSEGHTVVEAEHERKNHEGLDANVLTASLVDEDSRFHGFAVIVRDLNSRMWGAGVHNLNAAGRHLEITGEGPAVCVLHGEFDRILQANQAFLNLSGYSNTELHQGQMHWSEMSDPDSAAVDEWTYEQCLRFGASAPLPRTLIRKDGSKIAVEMTSATLSIRPFRWVAFLRLIDGIAAQDEKQDRAGPARSVFEEMVGHSAELHRVQKLVEVVAPTDATVLIVGETGTGKELVARAVHRLSTRQPFPFVTLNCAAIPTGLLESELFGYERGAFTGALAQKIGRFEMAHRGTLFLDEIGDIPLDLQPKLLRALQEKSFERLGGTKTIPIDVRLVAATNRNLSQMMGDKLFRSDLYYRLKVFPITTPPLRDRPEDIAELVRHFAGVYSAKMGRKVDKIPPATMQALVAWHWPGNIRELENFVERCVILSPGATLHAPLSEIPAGVVQVSGSSNLEEVERAHILKVLRECKGVITTAATRLGLHRTTLNATMRRLGITRRDI